MSKKVGKKIGFTLIVAAMVMLGLGGMAQAAVINDFTGVFAPGNWTTISSNSNGTTMTTQFFEFIIGPNNNSGTLGIQGVYMNSPGTYQIDFDWAYSTNDVSASWDPAFYANGTWNLLINSGTAGAGHVSFLASTGDLLGWKIESFDNLFGAANLNITKFVATEAAAVPEPSTLLLLGSGMLCLVGFGRRLAKR